MSSKKQTDPATAPKGRSHAAAAVYQVGRGRPPRHTRFKPGQSGNPRGRPRGSANASRIVKRALDRKVSVRKGDKTQTMTTLQAITESYSMKAMQGDRHAASFVLTLGAKTGVIRPHQDEPVANDDRSIPAVPQRHSEMLLEGVDVGLLSRAEMSELSRLLQLVDGNADVTALSLVQFERLQHLVGKGRGKNLVSATATEGGVQ